MITVSILRSDLVRKNIYSEGLAFYDELKSMFDKQRVSEGKFACRGIRIRWTRVHSLWLATAFPDFAQWLTAYGLIPNAYLVGANLKNANLVNAYLPFANLAEANLENACLAGTNLKNAHLARANLKNAYLEDTYLSGADLGNANLKSATLVGANLEGADLSHANLAGANLRSANLTRAKLYGADLGDYERDPNTGFARHK
jgi:uncharacterized protein YjbI with pentapeptide repeats